MNNEVLQNQLSHHWQHVRNVNKLRYSFTNFFAVLVVGLLTIATGSGSAQLILILLAVIFLSMIGIITYMKLGIEYYLWASHAIYLQKQLGVDDISARPSGLIEDGYETTLRSVLSNMLSLRRDFFTPEKIPTTELLSPSHWQMALQVMAFSVATGWLFGVLIRRYFGQYNILISVVSVIILFPILSYSIYKYGHEKLSQIDELIDEIDDELAC